MKKIAFILAILFFQAALLQSQDPKILRGISELRQIVFENYDMNLQQIELIRQKLDSVGVSKMEFLIFCNQLSYISKNLYEDELKNRDYLISFLLESKSYRQLTEIQKAIILDNIELIYYIRPGIWGERYPHRIDAHSFRSKEISDYGIKEGDEILHFNAYNNHLCDVVFLSFDSINISHYPLKFKQMDRRLFEMVGKCCSNDVRKLNYPVSKSSKLDSRKYDKIVYDALGFLDVRKQSKLKYRLKKIYKLLDDDGELIISGNAYFSPFIEHFGTEGYIDKMIRMVLKHKFTLKESINVENEYFVYKFSKVID